MPKTRQESYRILQLPENANEEEVKRAYKLKARELHPDKNPDDPNATKKFQDLSEAYQRIISGKRDGEELPEDFFIDPFELFINIILMKQRQQEQARRRFAQVFGFEGNDYEEEENFVYFGPRGFPFGGGFSFETSSRTAYGQRRFEQQARFNNQSESYHERRENNRWQKRASRDSFSQKSTDSEKRSKSKKTDESKRARESEETRENAAKYFSQNCDASVGNKNNSKIGKKLKKKSQQTSEAWQKGKKRNRKRGNKKQSVTITKKQSKENFEENSKHNGEMPMNSHEDFLEKKVCDKQTRGDGPEHIHIQECDNKPSTKVEMKNSVSAFSSNCNAEKVKLSDEMNESQFSESYSTTNTGTDKYNDVNSETNKVQATGKENLKSVDNKLIHSKTSGNKPGKPNINEVNHNATTMNKSAKRLENEFNEGSAETRTKVINPELTTKAKSVFTPSKSDRSWQPKKNNGKKKYVNSKFQNLKEPCSDFRLSDSKQADILESSDSGEKQVVKGKGFTWNKTKKPEEKGKRQNKMTKEEVSKNLSQKNNKEVEEQIKDINLKTNV